MPSSFFSWYSSSGDCLKSLDEAATIDGCGPVKIYTKIIIPLAFPALVTTMIFTFLWTWDDFFSQLIYLSDVSKYTVPLGLRLFLDSRLSIRLGSDVCHVGVVAGAMFYRIYRVSKVLRGRNRDLWAQRVIPRRNELIFPWGKEDGLHLLIKSCNKASSPR